MSIQLKPIFLLLYLLLISGVGKGESAPKDFEAVYNSLTEGLAENAVGATLHTSSWLINYYRTHQYQFIWQPTAAKQLLLALENSYIHGLNAEEYHLAQLQLTLMRWPQKQKDQIKLELLLTDAFLVFADHLAFGKVQKDLLQPQWGANLARINPDALLEQVRNQKSIKQLLNSFIPQHPGYVRLQETLLEFKKKPRREIREIPFLSKPLEPGSTHPQISNIRHNLWALGYIKNKQGLDQNTLIYDPQLEAVVRHFQLQHGLTGDGVIGERTIIALNESIASKIQKILINLERWRWYQNELDGFCVLVQIPKFKLHLMHSGNIESTHRIVVGRIHRKTPLLNSEIQYLVFNPTWTIPPTILNKDVLPKVKRNPDYLKNKNISVIDGTGKRLDPNTVNWYQPGANKYTYRQAPGLGNALGKIKFIFPNSYNVYLHDTPSKSLFNRDFRALSSGCIRVQEPMILAQKIMGFNGLSEIEIRRLTSQKQNNQLILKKKPKVILAYFTVDTFEAGPAKFLADIYSRDQAIWGALKKKPNS